MQATSSRGRIIPAAILFAREYPSLKVMTATTAPAMKRTPGTKVSISESRAAIAATASPSNAYRAERTVSMTAVTASRARQSIPSGIMVNRLMKVSVLSSRRQSLKTILV